MHPSYVEIIRKMNRLDALVFEKLSVERGYIKAVNPHISISGTNMFISGALPEWYLGWTIESYDEFAISASLVRLSKFGIIDLMYDRSVDKGDYSELERTPFLDKMLAGHTFFHPNDSLEITTTKCVVFVNEYGKQFREACR